MYPDGERPVYGIFVREQVEALRRCAPDMEIDVKYINPLHERTAYVRSVFSVSRIARGYDLVHVHYGLSGLFLLNPLRGELPPVVVTLHGGDILSEQGKWMQVRLTRHIIRRADAVVTLNQAMTDIVRPLVPRVEEIPCGIDVSRFRSKGVRLHGRRLLVVFPGDRRREVKDYPLFERTLGLLADRYRIDCEPVELNGMSRPEVASLFQRADLMLMTSVSEGSPQSVKEALACSLPVVSTPVGDVARLLSGVRDCAVAPDRSPETLASLVADVLNGRFPHGVSGSEKIRQLGLDADTVARRVYGLYNSLLR